MMLETMIPSRIGGPEETLLAGGLAKLSLMAPSPASRWARYILMAASSDLDPKTIRKWARVVGTSYTTLRDSCYVLAIKPNHARDLARALRVVARLALSSDQSVEVLLDVPDRRSLVKFCQRAGLRPKDRPDVRSYLRDQRLIVRDNPGVVVLLRVLGS